MLAKLLQATTLATIALLLKRLLVRGKRALPYRQANSNWSTRAYRKP
jgi:hypothetical protein